VKLENVAINDVLPLQAARPDASANLKCFGGSGTPAIQFRRLIAFTFIMRCHLILLASAPVPFHHLYNKLTYLLFRSFRLAKFGWARFLIFVCDAWQQSMQNVELTKGG